jgi:DNA-binding transcriptional MerR regulator/effector-binding domain-containing protein
MLRIGEFARLACVSVKTLRFYHSARVFAPACIDPRSGYRYYRIQQLAAFRQIRLLRTLGCSLDEVRRWAASPEGSRTRTALLEALRERLRSRMSSDIERLRILQLWIGDALPSRAHFVPIVPTEHAIAAIPAFTIRERVRSMARSVYRMFESAEQTVARLGARATRSPFLLFHDGDYREADMDVEVCVPIYGSALGAAGGRLVEGADRAACLRFSGTYDQGPLAYNIIRRWMESAGAHATGPLRETYLRFDADQVGYTVPGRQLAKTVADYRTELQVPIFR